MKSNFEEKKQNRIDRLNELSNKNEKLSSDLHKHSSDLVNGIPMGQPILVGHHSEGAHRRLLDKSWNAMGKSVEASKKSKHYAEKAHAAENNTAIFSDDPEAIRKLKEKIDNLEKQREQIKNVNAAWRKFDKKADDSALKALGITDQGILELKANIERAYSWEKQPYPKYMLTNLGANIRTAKQRLAKLQKAESDKTTTITINEVNIVDNTEENRLQIFFPGKPDSEVRQELKNHGFRWARNIGCWQRHRSNAANYLAKEIIEKYY